jgi:uncharacterized protein (TIGR03435 family)
MKPAVLIFVSLSAAMLVAQSASAPAFEVASIRKNTSAGGRTLMDGAGDRFSVTNATLRMLILTAFELLDDQLVGGPGWINNDRFDVVAGRGGAPFEQVPAMLRTLLAERFKLRTHSETRDMPMYTLVTARSDGALGEHMKVADCDRKNLSTGFPSASDKVLPCNVRFVGPGRLRGGGLRMRDLAAALTPIVGRIVLDRTGLPGRYDLELAWASDQPRRATDDIPAPDPDGASLFTALQEQLGLKLTGGRGPVDVLVIDSVSPPTEN